MSFFSLLAALVLGHYRPLPWPEWEQKFYVPYARLIEHYFSDGQKKHGAVAWTLTVLPPVIVLAAASIMLSLYSLLLAAPLAIVVLYFTLNFGRFGEVPEQIAANLRDHNLQEARSLLSNWQTCETQNYSANEVSRVAIETTLRQAHHALIAPIFWFLLIGPAGALLYRLSHALKTECDGDQDRYAGIAQRAFEWLDFMPARFTAGCFAIVGDFEDAVYCWRTQAANWHDSALGIVFASGAGALGVRLGEPLPCKGVIEFRPDLGTGDEADADYVQSAIGLLWRVLTLILGLMLLLTFAHWLGN